MTPVAQGATVLPAKAQSVWREIGGSMAPPYNVAENMWASGVGASYQGALVNLPGNTPIAVAGWPESQCDFYTAAGLKCPVGKAVAR